MIPNLGPHLESKTNGALLLLLAVVIGLTFFGKLTPEAVDAIKWLGGTFFGVRAAANITENIKKSKDE
jgi:threonine/homoserine/homoserine lactone efflux protein